VRRPPLPTVVSVVALVVAATGVAVAAIPGRDGTIRACYNKANGALRVISSGKCHKSEKALTWSQRGPQGAAGQNGQNGQNGNKGDKGDKGDTGNPGGQVAKLDYRRDNGSALETIFDSAGFLVQAVCQSGLTVQAKSKVDNGSIGFHGYSGTNAVSTIDSDFDVGQSVLLIGTTTDPAMGTVTYASPTGQVTTISFASALFSLGFGCAFSGTAVTT
jgi:hypothetical protein